MERHEYARLAAAEERMWWFRGLHANLSAALAWLPPDAAILDAGCGTGGLLRRLAQQRPRTRLVGLDLDPVAAATARAKSACPIAAGSIDRMPLADAAFDAILSADVLCHEGVDEHAALAEMRRCLKPGGLIVLNLPAYRWLYSRHDVAVANARRYERNELRRLLAAAGFIRIETRFWNSLLFPLMVVRRKLGLGAPASGSEVALLPAPIEEAFGLVLALERGLARAGLALPFGGSIVASAVKP